MGDAVVLAQLREHGEDVGEVVHHVEPVRARRGDHGQDRGAAPGRFGRAGERVATCISLHNVAGCGGSGRPGVPRCRRFSGSSRLGASCTSLHNPGRPSRGGLLDGLLREAPPSWTLCRRSSHRAPCRTSGRRAPAVVTSPRPSRGGGRPLGGGCRQDGGRVALGPVSHAVPETPEARGRSRHRRKTPSSRTFARPALARRDAACGSALRSLAARGEPG